jgi:aminoglycoside/choline kinase family phosphotransferase
MRACTPDAIRTNPLPMSQDSRREQLQQWLADLYGLPLVTVEPASADASFRRYFRFSVNDESFIVMDAPPDKENCEPFIRIGRQFYELGLNVPRILEIDTDQGFLLLSDLGNTVYLSQLNQNSVERLYGDALGALAVLQAGTLVNKDFLPEYDDTLLRNEMELFREWYLGRHLGITLTNEQQHMLDTVFSALAKSALEQPQVWVHRDYHSRNLMVTTSNNPGILDFQDAVMGPVTYDLVSLLRDCYIRWPEARVNDWVEGYFQLARQTGIPVGDDREQFTAWFDRMGVQRHLKATGIFARLCHRDEKTGYLADIPRTLGYVVDVSRRYEDLMPLAALIDELNIPYESLK